MSVNSESKQKRKPIVCTYQVRYKPDGEPEYPQEHEFYAEGHTYLDELAQKQYDSATKLWDIAYRKWEEANDARVFAEKQLIENTIVIPQREPEPEPKPILKKTPIIVRRIVSSNTAKTAVDAIIASINSDKTNRKIPQNKYCDIDTPRFDYNSIKESIATCQINSDYKEIGLTTVQTKQIEALNKQITSIDTKIVAKEQLIDQYHKKIDRISDNSSVTSKYESKIKKAQLSYEEEVAKITMRYELAMKRAKETYDSEVRMFETEKDIISNKYVEVQREEVNKLTGMITTYEEQIKQHETEKSGLLSAITTIQSPKVIPGATDFRKLRQVKNKLETKKAEINEYLKYFDDKKNELETYQYDKEFARYFDSDYDRASDYIQELIKSIDKNFLIQSVMLELNKINDILETINKLLENCKV